MANPFFSGRIPQELYEKAESYCKESGDSKTDLLIKALANYLNLPIEILKQNSYREIQVKMLEHSLVSTTIVIENDKTDNSDMEGKDLGQQSTDKNTDNNDNKQTEEKTDNNIISTDNIAEIGDNPPIYKDMSSAQLRGKLNITSAEAQNLKVQAFSKAQKMNYELIEEVRFKPRIEMILKKKKIMVNREEYKLYCEGIDENKKPIWTLEPFDNKSYQLNITES
jgi:hypothetical protein